MKKYTNINSSLGITLIALTLYGCGGSSSAPPARETYEFTLTNLTANQPISPVAIVLHKTGYQGWSTGSAASSGLEMLAEGGDNGSFLTEAQASASVLNTASSAGLLIPGGSEVVSMTATAGTGLHASLAGMLVNTNDAFAGVDGFSLDDIAVGTSKQIVLSAFDAGTEANSETAATIPGPAGGGTGFDATRDDANNFVTVHRGVITSSDGLVTSALDQSHRFDNPAMGVNIRRIN